MAKKRSSRAQRKNDKRSARDMAQHKINEHDAYCTECKTWYSVDSKSEVDKHRH